jgi:cytochrome c biogenesis protein CcmG/thiol:disulfide interchange protein DsbE
MSRASFYIPLGVFVLILSLGYVGFDLGARNDLPSALIDKPFPNFNARLLDDPEQTVTREQLLGRPTLVNVWATWCPTCLSEHEQLMLIAANTDVQLVGVNYKDRPEKALQWLAQFGNPYDLVLDDRDGLLGIEMGVYGAPETFLLDANGQVVYKRVGDINPRIWRAELAPRLKALGVAITDTAEQDSKDAS